MKRMFAMVQREYGPPSVLQPEEVPVPEPGQGEVRIKVKACGVCHHDLLVRDGTIRRHVELPLIPGHEVAGIVDAVGPGVRVLREGDRVASMQRETCGYCHYCRVGREPHCLNQRHIGHKTPGGYAEYVVVSEHALAQVPAGLAFKHAAVAACAIGSVYHAVMEEAHIRPGETVLVTGAGGGLGMHAVQLARLSGAKVLAVTTSPAKAETIRNLGAHEVILTSDLAFHKAVEALTGGMGADVVLDTVGEPVFRSSFKSLARDGRFVFLGQVTGGSIELNPALLLFKGARFLGSKSTTQPELCKVLDLLADGKIHSAVTADYPLKQAAVVHQLMHDRKIIGRAVLVPD